MSERDDGMELREMAAALRHGKLWLVGGVLVGLVLAALVMLLVPPRYEGTATVLIREYREGAGTTIGGGESSRSGGGGGFAALGGIADMLSLDAGLDTEIEILTSRAVAGAVVDSLGLQVRVTRPRGLPVRTVFSDARVDADIEEAVYRFRRDGDGYRVSGAGREYRTEAGEPLRLPGATVTLAAERAPDSFTVDLVDRREAVRRLLRGVNADQAGGQVAELTVRAGDAATAAAVTNAMIAKYLHRQRTSDRGVNQHRYEFLAAHTDSITAQLATAEEGLRRVQEETGVMDPEVQGEAELERAMALRGQLEQVEVQMRALDNILVDGQAGRISARELAGFPTLLQNPAINNLLSRIFELETRRTELLDRRTEADPDVVVLSESIRQMEAEIVSLAGAYRAGLASEEAEVRTELVGHRGTLAQLPAQAQEVYQRERETQRLSQTLVALQTQLVQARLAAIAEGGDVRQIDVAEPARRPVFPRADLTVGVGVLGGMFFGMVGAVASAYARRRVRQPWEAELATGLPAAWLRPESPLLLGGMNGSRSVMVIPVGDAHRAPEVAERLALTAALQGREAVFADFTRSNSGPKPLASPDRGAAGKEIARADRGQVAAPVESRNGQGYHVYQHPSGGDAAEVRRVMERLENRFSRVAAALPGLGEPATVAVMCPERPAVLVVRSRETSRRHLREAVATLDRMGVRVAGVVLEDPASGNGTAV